MIVAETREATDANLKPPTSEALDRARADAMPADSGTASPFAALPQPHDAIGSPRRIGVEIEFTGLSERRAAGLLASIYGGQVEEEDPYAFHVTGSALGRLSVERDMRHIHPHRRHRHPAPWLRPPASTLVGALVGGVVPRELVTEPLLPEALPILDGAVARLRAAGAAGDGATLAGSLGLHFNIAPPDLSVGTLLSFLRAYVLLEDALRAAIFTTPLLRWHAPEPFPTAYRRHVLAPDYAPDLESFAGDYLDANPTRKRGLDLLPLLLDRLGERVGRRISDKVTARPVLHYRLPVAHMGRAGWGLTAEWERWLAVERLATDPERLAAQAAERLAAP